MTILKKAGAVLLAVLLTLSLAACSGQETPSSSAAPEVSSETSPETSSEVSAVSSSSGEETGGAEEAIPYSAALDENGYFKGAKGLDYVTLPDYKAIEVPEDVSAVTEDDYAAELDSRLSAFTTEENVTDRAVADGDTVNIDYVGSVDGVAFDGGNTQGNGTTVTIGVTNYIDDFLEQLIGHKPGDTFNVNVTFPADYGVDNLNGKDAVFVTTINYIVEEKTPEFTDAFVAENWQETEGWSTVREAEEGIKNELKTVAVGNYLWEQIQQQAQVSEIPAVFTDYQATILKEYYMAYAESYGMSLDDFLTNVVNVFGEEGQSGAGELSPWEALLQQSEADLQSNAKASLILQALSEDLGIQIADEDIAAFFQRNMGSGDYASYEEEYGRPYLALLTREDLAKRQLGVRS